MSQALASHPHPAPALPRVRLRVPVAGLRRTLLETLGVPEPTP